MPVIDVKHPLVKHKVGLLREDDISTKKFRELTNELARLLAYEATADFPLEKTTIDCWSGPAEIEQIRGRKVTVVPILRAGLGMLDGVLDMIPSAKVSVVGLSPQPRDAAARALLREVRRPPRRAHRDHHRPDAGHRRLDDRHHRPAQAARLQGHPRAGAGGRARGHRARSTRRIPTCAAGRRRSTATSTRSATSFPGLGDAGDKIFGTK